ncbi:glutamate carboxypeptidase [Tamaricihabitans halophyticus]|uniref:Glutamate carboxypeptidase n=1 Tax=Tamaricihabitans halophyticus TaxID=1262583 RepID=A0A4R2QF94_9PSEU|nr:M20 family metallopeptidase [Tamaricihabitans halophyticus]TCP47349.1 glutamate carboxypeptidase [Tamaricihabitans halophyticus]
MTADTIPEWTAHALPEMTDDLRRLVELETPSYDKGLLDTGLARIHDWLTERLGAAAQARRYPGGEYGDALELNYPGDAPGTVLVLCHYDTVWPAGTLADWPFRVSEGKATGPGAFDMKLGLVQAVWALRCLRSLDIPAPSVRFLLNGDEEIGSPFAREHIERLSEGVLATLVCEASVDGALKTERKGVGLFEVAVRGLESHAGLDPDAGVSAIHELASMVPALVGMTDRSKGTTVNVGTIEGGTGRNVVAKHARCGIDIRISDPAEMRRIDEVLAGLRPVNPSAEVTVRGGWNRPPMVPNPGSDSLLAMAQRIAKEYGWQLEHAAVGGASDGNFVAALGRPVLDGLGAVGAGAHARHEHVRTEHIPSRTALLAGILRGLGEQPT